VNRFSRNFHFYSIAIFSLHRLLHVPLESYAHDSSFWTLPLLEHGIFISIRCCKLGSIHWIPNCNSLRVNLGENFLISNLIWSCNFVRLEIYMIISQIEIHRQQGTKIKRYDQPVAEPSSLLKIPRLDQSKWQL